MKPLYLDSETSKRPLCDPYNPAAKLCYVGVDDGTSYTDYSIEYSDEPYNERLDAIQSKIDASDIVVGANLKFDLGWLRRYGVTLSNQRVWDVLLVQFILNHQTTPFNSLNDVCEQWGLPQKLDIVKTEYWDRGIDTPDIPEPILREYQKQDVDILKPVFECQYAEVVKRGLLPLITTHNSDLLMLADMEWNGILYDVDGSLKADVLLREEINGIINTLNSLSPVVPTCWSTDFISLLLYGGTYKYKIKEPYTFVYKDGSTAEKVHTVIKEVELPRLVEPPKKQRAKEGFWPTDEATLKKLKTTGVAKKIVTQLLHMREIEKLSGTYLHGFPSKIAGSGWEGNLIHTNYNQAKVVTGRLSSDGPNVQNNPKEQKEFFISRYE